jgi:1A family penicillin-binding protein
MAEFVADPAGTTVALPEVMLFQTLERILAVVRSRPRALFAALTALSVAVWIVVGASVAFVYGAVSGLPDSEAVRTVGVMPRATTILDVKGRHAFTIFQEQRLHVPLARISPHLIRAIVAVEDQRFYEHGGFDVIRVVGAGVNNLVEGRIEQGGSTLTQQLARMAFLTQDKAYRRKLQEVVLATRLEDTFSKAEILELYLNKAYFGDGLYGVEAASLGYFGKRAADLTIAEAALIAGLVKSPSNYAPTANPDRALARRNLVLRIMRDAGAIDPASYAAALEQRLVLNDALRKEEAFGQYFKEEVRKELVERFGWDRVHHEGLRVETTIDLDMQKVAESEVARALAEIEKRSRSRAGEPLQAALVSLDPRTGEVRAMVGGRQFTESRFNRVTQAKRQPGSAFKPFVFAAAIERGFSPATVITGLDEPVMTVRGAWVPADGHVQADSMSMRAALRVSSNRAAVRVIEEVGIPEAADYAERFGMGELPQVPSLVLGSGEVTMLSLVSAYGVFANGGVLAQPRLIKRVTTADGQVLYQSKVGATEVISPSTAYLVTSMLEDVVDRGTAAQVRSLGFSRPAAGKTGTTNDYRDAWFVGYTPTLVTGVWVGYDKPRTIVPNGYAAQLAVPLWTRYMSTATRGDRARSFPVPDSIVGVEICPLSGKLATDACRRDPQVHPYIEHFAHGTAPGEYCPYHWQTSSTPVTLASTATPSVIGEPARTPAVPQQQQAVRSTEGVEQGTSAAAETEQPKKRGFWARVFGRRGNDKTGN